MAEKDLPYQQAGQVEQARQELELAKEQGNDERVKAAEKTLESLGASKRKSEAAKEAAAEARSQEQDKDEKPAQRSAPERQQQHTEHK